MTTLVYIQGFEHGVWSSNGAGIINSIVGAGSSIDSITKRTGNYSLKVLPAGVAQQLIFNMPASNTIMVGRFYVYFQTMPSDDTIIAWTTPNAGTTLWIMYNAGTGNLGVSNGGESVDFGAVTTGTWYRVDFRADCSANPHTIVAKLDGGTEQTTNKAQAASTWKFFIFGCGIEVTGEWYFDDMVLSCTSGDYPIGAGAVECLLPGSDGTHNAGTNTMERQDGADIGGTVTAYNLINTVPMGGTVSYIRQATNGTANYAEINFADTAQTTIQGGMAVLAYRAASATADNGACIIIDEDTTQTTVWGSPTSLADYSESSTFYKSAALPNPAGGWDATAVNALKTRLGYSGDTNPNPWWLDMIVEIAYGITSGATGTLSITQDANTITATGTVAIAGALAKTQDNNTISATGWRTITGVLSVNQDAQAISAAGVVAIAGALSKSQADQTLTGTGTVAIAGALSKAQDANTISATGTVADAGVITGSLAITQDANSITAAGKVAIAGAGTIIQAEQTITANGKVAIVGAASITQDNQTSSAAGTVLARGTLSKTQDAQTIISAGAVAIAGALSKNQDAHTLSATGTVTASAPIIGTLSITQASNSLTASGNLQVVGTLIGIQAAIVLVATGTVRNTRTGPTHTLLVMSSNADHVMDENEVLHVSNIREPLSID